MSIEKSEDQGRRPGWGRLFGGGGKRQFSDESKAMTPKWSLGVLNDWETVEVPGSVLLLASDRNEPLGLRNVHARTSHSSIPAGWPVEGPMTPGGTQPMPPTPTSAALSAPPRRPSASSHAADEAEEKKKTDDGTIILEPQPEDSANDPLNWPGWRRDLALLSLGLYCMIGGGITPLIAAGFQNVADTYGVAEQRISLTTGLYMMGLGVGSVIFSPTAILWGKRPVYLFSSFIFIGTSLWAGFSPTFTSLLIARVFQGISVSPVECLPSATIAEIFFLHERAFRIGIYTLLLLSGKNLVPLVSAAIISRFGWRWVFWIVAMVVALGGILLFFFVPETFWDRTPSKKPHKRPNFLRRFSSGPAGLGRKNSVPLIASGGMGDEEPTSPGVADRHKDAHVGFAPAAMTEDGNSLSLLATKSKEHDSNIATPEAVHQSHHQHRNLHVGFAEASDLEKQAETGVSTPGAPASLVPSTSATRGHQGIHATSADEELVLAGKPVLNIQPSEGSSQLDRTQSVTSASLQHDPNPASDARGASPPYNMTANGSAANVSSFSQGPNIGTEKISVRGPPTVKAYTNDLRHQPPKSFTQQLKPFHGRLKQDKWIKVMVRPFILYAYPAVLWSAAVYSLSIGWLIVVSESISLIFRDPPYNFSALGAGLLYVSPFIGAILGTLVAGKLSDVIVKAMSRRNGGLYEPEFRLVMAVPVLITTCIGLMGFGWSAQDDDAWIVPTIFFGIMSFGCSLGSTTSITFCVDSYRQYAGEALVTLNFSKNIFHGLVFSLFITNWLTDDGSKSVYIWLGVIHLIILLTTIPLYIYGKRLRMWTYRKNFMEKW